MALKGRLLDLLKRIVAAYALICAVMWLAQRHIIFLPQNNIGVPANYGLDDFSVVPLKTADGLQVQAWYHPAYTGYPTIVYFHGNGGNLKDRSRYFRQLSMRGFGIMALDYRGYGQSQGSPSEAGLYLDARAAVDYCIRTLALPPQRLLAYGESIGTGVAVQMATEYPFEGVVLQSPFTSLVALGQQSYPWLPIDFLMTDRFDSLSKIGRVHGPLLFLHGEQDDIVPIAEGKTLFNHAPEPKQAIYYPDRGHANFDAAVLSQAVLDFARAYKFVPSIQIRK